MAKFIMETLQSNSTSYNGPSGTIYVIYKEQPFSVENKEDIEFFNKNKRFKKVGVLAKAKPKKSDDELFAEELAKIEGVSEKTIAKVVKRYGRSQSLKDLVDQGDKIHSEVPAKQAKLIFNYYFEKKR